VFDIPLVFWVEALLIRGTWMEFLGEDLCLAVLAVFWKTFCGQTDV